MKLSWVVVTMGNRPEHVARSIDSIRDAHGDSEIVLVCNGCRHNRDTDVDTVVELADNVGVPGGRNAGWRAAGGDLICFLDDDATLSRGFQATTLADDFSLDPTLGVVSFRIRDPATGLTARRHVPRLRVGDPTKGSLATSFLGGACAVRRDALVETGGFWDRLFYSHEETDLAFRLIDAGYGVRYDPRYEVLHPGVDPRDRHPDATRLSMRNRLLIARRDLPWLVGVFYVLVWSVVTTVRVRSLAELKALVNGWSEGWRATGLDRKRIRWSTVWRLTRLGRPPIV